MDAREQEEANEVLAQYHAKIAQSLKWGKKAYEVCWGVDEITCLNNRAWDALDRYLLELFPWIKRGTLVRVQGTDGIVWLTGQVFMGQLPREMTTTAVGAVTVVEGMYVFRGEEMVPPEKRAPEWICLALLDPLDEQSPLAKRYRHAAVEAALIGEGAWTE